jgi:hypothetical protein
MRRPWSRRVAAGVLAAGLVLGGAACSDDDDGDGDTDTPTTVEGGDVTTTLAPATTEAPTTTAG